MKREVFEERLMLLTFREEARTTALVEEYRQELAQVQDLAIRYAQTQTVTGVGAGSLIAQLGETAVESLARSIVAQKPAPDLSLLLHMVKGVGLAETIVTDRLKVALTDKRLVPQPAEMEDLEEVDPPCRVCDEAYIALRRILHPESFLQFLMESRQFFSLPDAAKDQAIQNWLQTKTFPHFVDDVDIEEE